MQTTERSSLEAAPAPRGLGPAGRALWKEIAAGHDLNAAQRVQLHEACRAKDRLDKLDALLRGEVSAWAGVDVPERGLPSLVIDDALTKANATANLMKQLLAAMRLPDEATGKRPQLRSARGGYKPPVPVSSLDRARLAAGG